MKINGLELSDEDLNQRFQSSFIKIIIKNEPSPRVALVNKFHSAEYLIFNYSPQERLEIQTKKIEIVQEFPLMGAVNHNGDVHFLQRKPLRQWKRGLSYELITDFCRTNPNKGFDRYSLAFLEANSCFNRIWIPIEEGINNRNLRSFAINEHYWISGKHKKYLWRDICCLGEILGNKLFAFPSVCIMKEEINQELGGTYEIS